MPEQDQERCIDEITEDDMIWKFLCRREHGYGGEHGHGGEAGKYEFSGKGNRSLPLGDAEEDWETLGSGVSEEMDRPGMSKDLGSGGTEESGRPGESKEREGSGLEMPVRRVCVVEGVF